jgi:hypothetical protein
MLAGRSGQHFQQYAMPSLSVDFSHFFAQPDFVDAPQLVEQDSGPFALKSHLWATSQGLPALVKGAMMTLGKA